MGEPISMLSIRGTRAFPGPSGWSRQPVLWLMVEATAAVVADRDAAAELLRKARLLIVEIDDPTPAAHALDFVSCPEPDTFPALLGAVAIDLQRQAGLPVEFHAVRRTPDPRLFEVVIEQWEESVARESVRLAMRLIEHLTGARTAFDLTNEFVSRLSTLAEARRQSACGERMLAAARARGIPISRVDPSGRIVELGTGVYRRRFFGSVTSETSKLGDRISADKSLAKRYLAAAGVPVPEGRAVRTAEQAVDAARALGFPVVVKPNDAAGSAGVGAGLLDEESVRTSFEAAFRFSTDGIVLVERQVPGRLHRVAVVNDRLIATMVHLPPEVTGDGQLTIRELIDIEQANPLRGVKHRHPMKRILVDDETTRELRRQGYSLDSVPPAGQRITVRANGKTVFGGTPVDITDEVHPDNVEILRTATRAVGLDNAGIDVVAPDLRQSIWETSGAVLELNTLSGYRLELYPAVGAPRDVGPAMIDMLYPAGAPVRVPVIVVLGEQAAGVCERLAVEFEQAGMVVGLTAGNEVRVGGVRLLPDWNRDPSGARTVLNNPATEIAVIEVPARQINACGLGFDVCDVVVLTSMSGLTTPFGEPVEWLVTELVDAGGVVIIDADDPEVVMLTSGEHGNGGVVAANGCEHIVAVAVGWWKDRSPVMRNHP